MLERIQRVAVAGNSAALVLVILVLALGPRLFSEAPSGFSVRTAAPAGPPAARGVLLFVVDGLRRDFAFDPARMPCFARLARQGGRGTARVESLIPSTVAGIRTLAEGRVPPPVSFLEDFRSSRAKDGGIFAAAAAAGHRTFAAGPRLWADLYGPWLEGSASVTTVGGDDERIVRAALAEVRKGGGFQVVHCSEPDDAAHLAGPFSPGYARAARHCDDALNALVAAGGPGLAVLATADHGVSDRGGHAGPEPEVTRVPVAVAGLGMPRGDLGEIRQSDLGRLILAPLGLARGTEAPSPAQRGRDGEGVVLLALAGLLALGSALVHWTHLATAERNRVPSTVLNGALWISLGLAIAGYRTAAVAVALGALVGLTLRTSTALGTPACSRQLIFTCRQDAGAPSRGISGLGVRAGLIALSTGLAAGALRLADGLFSTGTGLPPAALIVAIALLAVLLGWLAGHRLSPLASGLAAALVPPALARILGETASLSTLDVRLAFRLVDGPLGLPGAVTAAALQPALPFLAFLAGFFLSGTLSRRHPSQAGGFGAGMAAALAGQAAAAAVAFAAAGGAGAGAAVALGLLVRLAGEVNGLFLGSAAALGLGWAAATLPGVVRRRRAGRSRRLAATAP
jgi:hypothetical protein